MGNFGLDYIGISISRWPEDELDVSVNDGNAKGFGSMEIPSKWLREIGEALIAFPESRKDFCSFITPLKITKPKLATALDITIYSLSSKEDPSSFLILADPNAIHRLGRLLKEFSNPRYGLFIWSLTGDHDRVEE